MAQRNVGNEKKAPQQLYRSAPYKAGLADYGAGRWRADDFVGNLHGVPRSMIYEFGRAHAAAKATGASWFDVWPRGVAR